MRLAHIHGDRVYNSIRIMKYDASWGWAEVGERKYLSLRTAITYYW